ncbi:MAG TPA: hypothetical protein VGH43_09820 [Jatrophihabitans sp.]|jgi:uncharacterized protein YukE
MATDQFEVATGSLCATAGTFGDRADAAGRIAEQADLAKDVADFAGGHSGTLMDDPLAAVIEAGLSFLIDLIAPLKEALDIVTGDPDGLDVKADEWAAVAERLRRLGPTVGQDAARTQASWRGRAGDAFRAKIATFELGIDGVADRADNVASVLRISATLMDGAQGIIKSIIASWVEYAILTAQDQAKDGHESQRHIDDDLSWR